MKQQGYGRIINHHVCGGGVWKCKARAELRCRQGWRRWHDASFTHELGRAHGELHRARLYRN
jgi:hypothetical protein